MWLKNAERFEELWNFNHCVAALDGKHVRIQCPTQGGSMYFNYKSFHSIQIQAVVDADLLFTVVDIGDYGKNSDGAAFKNSVLGQAFLNDDLHLPRPTTLPGTNVLAPFCFVADEAYPLKENLMRPYDGRTLNNRRRVFNQRLSRARKVVECAFGILAKKWEIFQQPLRADVENAEKFVKAACALHNFVRTRDGKMQDKPTTTGTGESPEADSNALLDWERIEHPGRRSDKAINAREAFADYFMSDQGRVDWVNELVCI